MEITKTKKILRLKEQNYIPSGFYLGPSLFWGGICGQYWSNPDLYFYSFLL